MNIDEASVQERCTDAVFERGKNYRDDGRIGDSSGLMTLSQLRSAAPTCTTLPSSWAETISMRGVHVPTRDRASVSTSSRYSWMSFTIRPRTRSSASTRQSEPSHPTTCGAFVRDALAENPILRERFLARFGEERRSIDEYRVEAETLFERHARDDSP